MIPVLVLLGLWVALYYCCAAGFGVAPKVTIPRRPKPEPERLMTRWATWLLERDLEVQTDEPGVVMAAITARLDEEDISSDELADMRRASEEIHREASIRMERATRLLLMPPTARTERR